ncbi:MAG TPA: EAL domain-containing protein [Steroidobacteraceae bacterium]|nr:EAL domain-containing protein [Steroidobacteraceae bacterium]
MSTRADKGPVAVIADDEDLGRLLLAESATAAGLVPIATDNGLAALEAALAQDDTALVLLDVDMPGLDGYSVCRRLRAEPRFATLPIVIVTGHDDSKAVARAFDAGATDFVQKPVNWTLLPYRLEYILRNAAQIRALAEREAQVRTLVEALPDRLWVVTVDGEIRWSPRIFDGDPSGVASTSSHNLRLGMAPPQQLERALDAIRATAADGVARKLDYREARAAGKERSYELRFSRREGGDVVVVRRDTSERAAAAERIERLAYFDPLTSLPNRQRCLETADRLVAEAAAAGESVAVVYLDLNGFKRINDTFGHPVGDAVLQTVATKLAATIARFERQHEHLSLARFGGDEFVVLLRHAAAAAPALEIANACYATLKEPIAYRGLEFHSTPSIGIAVYPEDGPDVATVLKHADTAMYQAKSAATGAIAVYAPAMSSRLRDWLDLEAKLRKALRSEQLQLQYQPKFRLADDQVVGLEALVRWCDTDHGQVPPARFVSIAEDSGLIIDLGAWVMRAACRQVRAWLDQGRAIPVAINVSAKELVHGDPARTLEQEAQAAGIPASLIEIELTESLLVKDSATVRGALDRFRRLGCRIALDDFGTGYSSLAYITRFPPDRIKIDQAFVRNVDRSPSDAAIANAILSLGESLRLTVTAEGIETPAQLAWLRRRGCHEGQGFLLSRPLSAADVTARFPPRAGAAAGAAEGRPAGSRRR